MVVVSSEPAWSVDSPLLGFAESKSGESNTACPTDGSTLRKCAVFLATMTVNAKASASTMTQTVTAAIFHAFFTQRGSNLSGHIKSKKNAAPNTVATAIPTKML